MPAKFVRVRDARTGHEYTVTEKRAKRDSDLHPISDPAVDASGRPLPEKIATPKPKTK